MDEPSGEESSGEESSRRRARSRGQARVDGGALSNAEATGEGGLQCGSSRVKWELGPWLMLHGGYRLRHV